jgi:trk system potassium uptake protein TrkA
MRVIICGAGQVGFSITSYLARENNDVTVIDQCPQMIARVNMDLDANGIVGSASSPEVLNKAGASDADMIIAVTQNDEVNMVACQVAHSLFNVPRKIARIREQAYRDPAWANLFSRAHMPIDVIISPEVEVANAFDMRLSIPGTTTVTPLADESLYMCGVLCEENCPLVNTPLGQLNDLFPNMKTKIIAIARNGKAFIPDESSQMLIGDEVFFVVERMHIERVLHSFGHEEKKAHNVIVVGGGNIGLSLIEKIQKSQKNVNLKVIEHDSERAIKLSEKLEDVLILNASGLEKKILEEANISSTDTLIAVTEDDETNILVSLLARQYGCERVIPLVNREAYNALTGTLGLGAVVSPKSITVSSIMRHVRRGRVKAVHNLLGDFAEILEIEASESSSVLNMPLKDLNLPDGILVCAIRRDNDIIMPDAEDSIKADDHVIILAEQSHAIDIEKMFSPQVDIF